MPKVSEAHKEAVRRRIVDAAIVCLERNGFQDVTTRDILTEAGLSTGTFYNYFPSKEHLYEALAKELLIEDVTRIVSAGAVGGDDGDDGGDATGEPALGVGLGLLALLRDYMLTDQRPAIAVSNFRSRTQGDEAVEAIRRLNGWIADAFTPLVAQAQAGGFLREDLDPRAVVELLDIVWDGLGRRAAQDSFQTGYEEVGALLLQVLLRGILADPAVAEGVPLVPQPVPPPSRTWPV